MFASAASGQQPASRPNVLVFFVDDMGWGQPGCYGGKLAPTPHIDALAASGVRFTDGYVSGPVCSPSRVALLTGRYQARTGHDGLTAWRRKGSEMALSETTIAQRFKSIGYSTGIIGKWHVGGSTPEYLPAARGFDYCVGSVANINEGEKPEYYRGAERVETLPGVPITSPYYAQEAAKFIETNRGKPWFLYVPTNGVHSPLVATEQSLGRFKDLEGRKRNYAGIVADTDELVGTVMKKLRDAGAEENTLVFFISDNGGANELAEMGPLRGEKWDLWEGGVRVSWIAAWKGRIPGGRVEKTPVIQVDVLPTALAAAGAPAAADPNVPIDGANLMPLLEGRPEAVAALAERPLFFRFGPQQAVRQGDWKLVKAAKDMEPMLINLAEDPGEQADLSAKNPAKKAELVALWDAWNASMQPPRWNDARMGGKEARQAAIKARNARGGDPATSPVLD